MGIHRVRGISTFLARKDDHDKAKELYLKALAIAKEKSDIDTSRKARRHRTPNQA